MNRVLGWHTRIGDAGFRLAHLQLLWIAHTLMGGVVLGAYPATAAVLSVLRRDHMEEAGWEGARDRPSLWREFHDVWRAELVGANVIGLVLTAGWAVVLYDHRLLRAAGSGAVDLAAAPVLQWLLWILTLVLLVVTATVFVLRAHFAEGPVGILRRSVVLTIARPVLALVCAGTLGVTLGLYYVLPGLAVVFGVVAPAFAVMAYVWQTGVLPRPAAPASASSSASVSSPAPQPSKEPARA
ncbi:DUF624 domain-containing protein [Sanguibacter sp. 25GB23B1]|uniref:YesL family protein n=1 Tax=unclassified Sanguibacter TaxID=2645534 RepID=UPI0032AE88AA